MKKLVMGCGVIVAILFMVFVMIGGWAIRQPPPPPLAERIETACIKEFPYSERQEMECKLRLMAEVALDQQAAKDQADQEHLDRARRQAVY